MVQFEGKLDPAEVLDFVMDFGGGVLPVLDVDNGEQIDEATLELAVTAEAAAFGLEIVDDDIDYAPDVITVGKQIRLYLRVNPSFQADPAFDSGIALGVTATFDTTSTPARTRERTFLVEVVQL